jgi:hypothetical protein
MTDISDPYADIKTDKERQAVYQNLLAQYELDRAWRSAEYARQKEVYDTSLKTWSHFRETQIREDGEFCKRISLFAAGSFGVSFAFIDKIVPFQTALHKPVIVAAWACFAVALIVNVAIHLTSAAIHGSYCDVINGNTQREYNGEPALPLRQWYTGWVMSVMYGLNFIAFLGGMACLIAFVVINI